MIVGSARDIVTHCGVPRFLFTDFPLGNPAGAPGRPHMQHAIVAQALRLLETASAPRTIETAPFTWHEGDIWRTRYGRIDPAEIARLRAEGDDRRRRQAAAKSLKTSLPRNG